MPGYLRVNRTRVRMALDWLKENNPFYEHLTISAERLDALPKDDIPKEIVNLVKFSDDTRPLAEEQDGYVPSTQTTSMTVQRTCLRASILFYKS